MIVDFPTSVYIQAPDAGGRMSTSQFPTLDVDMGAQYITAFMPRGNEDRGTLNMMVSLYKELTAEGLFVRFKGRIEGEREPLCCVVPQHYVALKGMSSICKHFLSQSKAGMFYQRKLCRMDVSDHRERKTIHCQAESSEGSEFDAVVLTMPAPQLLEIKGYVQSSLDPKLRNDLGAVKYSSRYALGLFYDTSLLSDRVFRTHWTAKYFDDPVIRFVCWDNLKRGYTDIDGRTLLVHTTVPFGLEHLEEEKDQVRSLILQSLERLIPGLPPATHSQMVRWRYSQVHKMFPGSHDCVVLSRDPLIIATGDSFSDSNFTNCVRAVHLTAKVMSEVMS